MRHWTIRGKQIKKICFGKVATQLAKQKNTPIKLNLILNLKDKA